MRARRGARAPRRGHGRRGERPAISPRTSAASSDRHRDARTTLRPARPPLRRRRRRRECGAPIPAARPERWRLARVAPRADRTREDRANPGSRPTLRARPKARARARRRRALAGLRPSDQDIDRPSHGGHGPPRSVRQIDEHLLEHEAVCRSRRPRDAPVLLGEGARRRSRGASAHARRRQASRRGCDHVVEERRPLDDHARDVPLPLEPRRARASARSTGAGRRSCGTRQSRASLRRCALRSPWRRDRPSRRSATPRTPRWIANLVEEHAITVALSARGEARGCSRAERHGRTHCDIVRKVAVEAEHPPARRDIARRVERRKLPFGVNARVGAARPAWPARVRIDCEHRTAKRLFDSPPFALRRPAVKVGAVVRNLEQHAVRVFFHGDALCHEIAPGA